MSHPPIPPKSDFFLDDELDCFVLPDGTIYRLSTQSCKTGFSAEKRLIAAVAEVEWRKIAEQLDIELPQPSLNHTRGDSELYPCDLCRDAVEARKQISIAYQHADAWRAWAEEKPIPVGEWRVKLERRTVRSGNW